MGIAENGRGGSVLAEDIEDFLYAAAFLAACVELAVGVGTSTTFTKAIVAFWVDTLVTLDGRHVLLAFSDILASLYDHRAIAQLYQVQGCE